MLVSYKHIPMNYIVSCRMQEHILDNQNTFTCQHELNTPQNIQEERSLEVTNKIREKFESNDQNGLIEQINSFILLIPSYDLNTFPGFLENNIPEIFYNILNSNNFELMNLVYSVIIKLIPYQQIFQQFLTQDFIKILINYLGIVDLDASSYDPFLFLKSILIFSQEQDNIHFLIENSVIEMICNYIKDSNDATFINICIDILILFSKIHLENENVIEIFDTINSLRDGPVSRVGFIEKTFKLLNNLFISGSMIFELFEDSGFNELVQAYLNSPYEVTTYYACFLISHVYSKFHHNYQFYMRKLLQLIYYEDPTNEITEKCSMAASIALSAQLTVKPNLARNLMNEDTFQQIFIAAQGKNTATKAALINVLLCLVKESTDENFWKIFAVGQNQQTDIFDFISGLAEINNHTLKVSLQLLLEIFEKSSLFNMLDECKENFLRAFSESFFEKADNYDDEDITSKLQALRNYL